MPLNIFLAQREPLACRNADLPAHQIDSCDPFRNWMLNLKPRIHFEEIKIALLVGQKLKRAGIRVMCGRGYAQCRVADSVAQAWIRKH